MKQAKFEFRDYTVPVDIAGKKYTLDCSTETGEYMAGVGKRLRELAAELQAGSVTLDDVFEYGKNVLDYLLGAGAAAEIFADRRIRLDDMADLCIFLTQTATVYQRERQANREKLVLK